MIQKRYIQNTLKDARIGAGLTQQEVAELLDWKYTDRLSDWERGVGVPNIFNLFKLCQIYHKLPHQLYPDLLNMHASLSGDSEASIEYD